jgi:hypothetical protein
MKAKSGDILVWKWQRHGFPFGHAAIVVQPTGKTAKGEPHGTMLIDVGGEFRNRGRVINHCFLAGLTVKPAMVFQLQDTLGRLLADDAANAAKVWFEAGKKKCSYSANAAFKSPFTQSSYGKKARERAKEYRDSFRNTKKLPPSFAGSLFCSMFVIAAYQAASYGDEQLRHYLWLDAVHTQPTTLKRYCGNTSNWKECTFSQYDFNGIHSV